MPAIPPSDEVRAEAESRSCGDCPGCKIRSAVDEALTWPTRDRAELLLVIVDEAERLSDSIRKGW